MKLHIHLALVDDILVNFFLLIRSASDPELFMFYFCQIVFLH